MYLPKYPAAAILVSELCGVICHFYHLDKSVLLIKFNDVFMFLYYTNIKMINSTVSVSLYLTVPINSALIGPKCLSLVNGLLI